MPHPDIHTKVTGIDLDSEQMVPVQYVNYNEMIGSEKATVA